MTQLIHELSDQKSGNQNKTISLNWRIFGDWFKQSINIKAIPKIFQLIPKSVEFTAVFPFELFDIEVIGGSATFPRLVTILQNKVKKRK